MSKYSLLKRRCLGGNLQIPIHKLALFSFGNLSIIDRNKGVFAIKPSGVPYQTLTEESVVVLDLNGNVLEGRLKPSSDTKTHLHLYEKWKDVNSICHTHSTYSVGWAQSLLNVPVYGTTHADHLTRDIPCTEPMDDFMIKGDYELNTGVQITDHFKKEKISPSEVQMCLVGSHGPFTWGKDEAESLYNSVVLEEICKMAFITKAINPTINKIKNSLIEKHYTRKHGKNSYYGQ